MTFYTKNLVNQIQVFRIITNQQTLPWPNQRLPQTNAKRIWKRILYRILDPHFNEDLKPDLDPFWGLFEKDLILFQLFIVILLKCQLVQEKLITYLSKLGF